MQVAQQNVVPQPQTTKTCNRSDSLSQPAPPSSCMPRRRTAGKQQQQGEATQQIRGRVMIVIMRRQRAGECKKQTAAHRRHPRTTKQAINHQPRTTTRAQHKQLTNEPSSTNQKPCYWKQITRHQSKQEEEEVVLTCSNKKRQHATPPEARAAHAPAHKNKHQPVTSYPHHAPTTQERTRQSTSNQKWPSSAACVSVLTRRGRRS